MQFSMKKLAVWVSIVCVVAFAIGRYANSPERRVKIAGIDYNRNLKGGTFLHSPNNGEFDDETLAAVVEIAADFSEPHAIRISGNTVTENGFKIFESAPNISSIWLTDLDVSDDVLKYFDNMPDLLHLRIKNCPYMLESEIHKFRLANTKINVESE